MDWNKIKKKAAELYTESTKKVRKYTPENFSKEKKFVNSLVISLVLMTMADKKAETDEVTASMDLINEIDEIKELEMTQDAIELYELHLDSLINVIDNDIKWTILIAKLLSEITKVKPYPEYPPMIENLLIYIAESDGNICQSEIDMKEKILKSLQ
jgi:tellurite resistance protein